MKRQLNAMSLKQLEAHYELVKGMLESRKLEERKTAAANEARVAAKKYGFNLSELVNVPIQESKKRDRKARKTVGKVPFKYQNPNDKEQKWAGRGRSPKWVVEYIDGGGALTDLLIQTDENNEQSLPLEL